MEEVVWESSGLDFRCAKMDLNLIEQKKLWMTGYSKPR
jgi:hypothetical protein